MSSSRLRNSAIHYPLQTDNMSSPPSQSHPAHTFPSLVDGVIAHPLFPLFVRKVFELCHPGAFERSKLLPNFSEIESSALGLQNFALEHGLTSACERWTSTDVFMSALVTALNQVKIYGSGNHRDLHQTIAAGQSALKPALTDPHFVGATEIKQAAGKARKGDREQEYSNESAQVNGNADRQAGTYPSNIIRKPTHASRTTLSDRAKGILEKWFQDHLEDPYPTTNQKQELAELCGVRLSSIINWFGNKRMRIKRKMLQEESQAGEQVVGKILAPKSKWNAVVVSKMKSTGGQRVIADATGSVLETREPAGLERPANNLRTQEVLGQSGPGRPRNLS